MLKTWIISLSTATNNGTASINVIFKEGVDPDIASVNVQNRVARATPLLPAEVTRTGVVTQKQQTSALMFVSFYSENENIDRTFIQNYMDINIIPELKRVNGVGDAVLWSRTYSMRIWLDPVKMANYGLVPSDVTLLLTNRAWKLQLVNWEKTVEKLPICYSIQWKYRTEEQYENIVIKSLDQGKILYLKM